MAEPLPSQPVRTEILPADHPGAIAAAVAQLRAGQPVALPSETVYGLAADALNPKAVARVFEAKERPFFDPLIVHLPSPAWLEKIARVADDCRGLIGRLTSDFWPGPLTLVLPRAGLVPDIVCAGLETVAVRCPAHPVFAAVLNALDRPLAAPSANRFGRISPTRAEHVAEELNGRISLVLDAGPTEHGVESTIVQPGTDCLTILRNGPVTPEQLAEFSRVKFAGPTDTHGPVAPGRLPAHYAPRTPLRLLAPGAIPAPEPGKRCGLLAWQSVGAGFARVERPGATGDLRAAAVNLFAAMRRLDAAGLDLILAETVPDEGLGRAINDRLRRAAHAETMQVRP